ncbi:MAG TPA: hypothetical protein VGE24_08195 [Emticicia sp.]
MVEVDSASISDLHNYQKEKFKNPKVAHVAELKPTQYGKIYKLKNSDDLIQITPRLDKELLENWDKAILGYIETFTVGARDDEKFIEHINNQNSKAVIFFVRNYKLSNANFILYKNIGAKITLFITYISNSPDEIKIANMRKIIKGMAFK